jgi:ABC-type glycerol-3-phosphate transport system substrate-binding protein
VAAAAAPKTIVVWSESRTGVVPVDNAVDKAMVAAFDKAYPQYRLQITRLPSSTYRTKDFAALQANQPIDVIKMDNADLATYWYGGAITPINRDLSQWSHHLRMNLFKTTAINVRILGVPDNSYALALVVRKDWVAKYHLPQPRT